MSRIWYDCCGHNRFLGELGTAKSVNHLFMLKLVRFYRHKLLY